MQIADCRLRERRGRFRTRDYLGGAQARGSQLAQAGIVPGLAELLAVGAENQRVVQERRRRGLAEQARKLKAHGFLNKPVLASRLLETVAVLLGPD